MCGILALYQPKRRWAKADFERALNTLEARGPDAYGIWGEEGVFLGHRRLSIIDLEGGAQPMLSEDGMQVVTYNGEIYNFQELRDELRRRGHHFQGRSDTEVILVAWREWGASCLEHFEGMFAFVIWDRSSQTFFAARDRTGIKPLYLGEHDGSVIFSSTLEPFFQLDGFDCRVDPEAIRDVLVYDYVPAPRSMLKAVRKVQPGHFVEWQVGRPVPATRAYWEVPACSGEGLPFEEMVERCDSLLDSAIRRQMVSDVPLGAFLSGGIDSSLIVSSMARASSRPVKTFSVSFSEGSNEAPIARLVAERLKTDHVEVEAGTIASEQVLETLGLMDEPLSDPALVPTRLISRIAREHVKVVLSGEGGDEVFGGYPRYFDDGSSAPAAPGVLARSAKALLDASPWRIPGAGRVYKKLCNARELLEIERVHFGAVGPGYGGLRHVLNLPPDLYQPACYLDDFSEKMSRFSDAYDADSLMRVDMTTKLSENHLVKSDRASMMESLELRVPFLDERILDEFLPRPTSSKIVGGQLKAVLVALCRERLPREVWDRPKHGFNVPMGRYMAVEWKEMVEELLCFGESSVDVFNYRFLRKAQRQNQKTRQVARTLWSPLMLLAWFRAHPGARI